MCNFPKKRITESVIIVIALFLNPANNTTNIAIIFIEKPTIASQIKLLSKLLKKENSKIITTQLV